MFTAESNLAFGGMDIDIDLLRGQEDVDRSDGMLSCHQHAAVGLFYSIGQRSALDPAPVDEEAEVSASGAVDAGRADKT